MKGAMGAAPNPVCWHETRARGFGELIPSVFIQHRPRPSGIRHPTSSISIVLLSTCSVSSAISVQQSLQSWSLHFPVPRGPTQGTSPHPFVLAREFFLPSLATGTGQGKRECQHHGGIAARLARANPPSIRIHPPSSFTSCLGPWEKEERDEQELRLCQGGRCGEKHTKTTGKILCILRKCQ